MLELIAVKNNLTIGFFLVALLAPRFALQAAEDGNAKTANETKVNTAKKRISLKFDNELVTTSGEGQPINYMYVRSEANFKKMMKLRESFLPEVKRGKRDFSGSQ